MGALSLNQAGQNLLQARSNVINLVFRVFTSDVHIIALQEKSNANLIGGDVDELVRHHPWLKPSIFTAITSTLSQIEEAVERYVPKAGMEGYFRFLLGKSPEPEAGTSSGEAQMETDQLATTTTSSGAALPNSGALTPQTSSNGDSSYHITEIPPYQYLNCFSKVGCTHPMGMIPDISSVPHRVLLARSARSRTAHRNGYPGSIGSTTHGTSVAHWFPIGSQS